MISQLSRADNRIIDCSTFKSGKDEMQCESFKIAYGKTDKILINVEKDHFVRLAFLRVAGDTAIEAMTKAVDQLQNNMDQASSTCKSEIMDFVTLWKGDNLFYRNSKRLEDLSDDEKKLRDNALGIAASSAESASLETAGFSKVIRGAWCKGMIDLVEAEQADINNPIIDVEARQKAAACIKDKIKTNPEALSRLNDKWQKAFGAYIKT